MAAHLPANEHKQRGCSREVWQSGVSSAAELHHVKPRVRKHAVLCDPKGNTTTNKGRPIKKEPGKRRTLVCRLFF
jgi:hypothetical protein